MMILDPLYLVPKDVQTRWASPENWDGQKGGACMGNDGRKRSPCLPLPAGGSKVLLDVQNTPGIVRRIWVTIDDRSPKMLRGLRLDAFWDGATKPAISAPLGDFFCHGLGRISAFQNALFSSPEGRSFTCYLPMPFRSGARFVVTNETDTDLSMFFYDIDYTIGDAHPETMTYLHAHWRRENPTMQQRDYQILPLVGGRGRFLGANLGVIANTGAYFKSWWGEGEVKIYLDGDQEHPTLCGTGTEDYIGTGWSQGQYASLYQGCPIADHELFQYGFYRLHLPDPVWFQQDARVTIQQIGCWNPNTIPQLAGTGLQLVHGQEKIDMAAAVKERGYGGFERQDDVSSCAWFYLDQPVSGLPALSTVEERLVRLV